MTPSLTRSHEPKATGYTCTSAGKAPFKEVGRHGAIPLGGAVLTSAGKLPFKAIIHVAEINMLWRASERSMRDSVKNAIQRAHKKGFHSIVFPLIGAGSGVFVLHSKSKAKSRLASL